jgi:hypothetical protein
MTKSTELELFIGPMVENMPALGRTASSMEEDSTIWYQDKSAWENGFKERE